MDSEVQKLIDRLKIADNPQIVRDLERKKDNELAMLADTKGPIATLAAFVLERRLVKITARATIIAAIISGILGGIVGFVLAKISESDIFNGERPKQECRQTSQPKGSALDPLQVPLDGKPVN